MDESNYSNCVWTNRTRKTDRAHNTDMLQRIYVPYQAYVGMILVCMDLCCHVVLKNKKNGLHEPQYNMLCTFYEDDYVSVQFNCFWGLCLHCFGYNSTGITEVASYPGQNEWPEYEAEGVLQIIIHQFTVTTCLYGSPGSRFHVHFASTKS